MGSESLASASRVALNLVLLCGWWLAISRSAGTDLEIPVLLGCATFWYLCARADSGA